LNLVGCTTDDTFSVDTRAGATVTVVINPVTATINVTDEAGGAVANARVLIETSATAGGGEIHEAAVTTLTQLAGTATCTTTAVHNLETGDKVLIRGAQPDNYNKVTTATVTSTTIFTYPVSDTPSSPATGTPIVSYVAVQALTSGGGVASVTRTFGADQDFKGWARLKNTSSPFYKDGNIAFTLDSTNGNTVNVTLQDDE